MHVVARAVGLLQHLFPGEVGEDSEFDLGVVGAEQCPAFLGEERFADATAVFRANGNVLQVGVAAAQAARRRYGLVEVGVDAAGFRFDELGQSIDVGALELAQDAVLQHEGNDGMVVFEFFENGGIRAESGFRAPRLLAIQSERVEQQFPELFWRGEVEVHLCHLFGLSF